MRTRDRGPDENLGIDTNVQKKKKKGKGFINRFLVRETRNHFRYFKPRGIEYRGLSRKAGGRLGEQRGEDGVKRGRDVQEAGDMSLQVSSGL